MESSLFQIRYAVPADATLLAEMGARAFYETFAAQNTAEDMAAYLAESFSPGKQAQELAQPGSVFLIAESEGKPAGYARLQEGPAPDCITGSHPIELVRLYLLPEWIGKGNGAKLMQACIDEARGRGADVLWLGVWKKNARARAFYQKWGFTTAGEHTFQLGSDLQIDDLMQRPI